MEARIADTIEAASVTRTVDARGQSCPGPLVTLHKALVDVPSGELVELLATDPGGLQGRATFTMQVTNRPPVAVVAVLGEPVAGKELLLRGGL